MFYFVLLSKLNSDICSEVNTIAICAKLYSCVQSTWTHKKKIIIILYVVITVGMSSFFITITHMITTTIIIIQRKCVIVIHPFYMRIILHSVLEPVSEGMAVDTVTRMLGYHVPPTYTLMGNLVIPIQPSHMFFDCSNKST